MGYTSRGCIHCGRIINSELRELQKGLPRGDGEVVPLRPVVDEGDKGELVARKEEFIGMAPELAFVLGAEYMEFRSLLTLSGNDGFGLWIHSHNEERLKQLCWKRRRKCNIGRRAKDRVFFMVERV